MMYYKASSVAAIYSSNSCGGAPYLEEIKISNH